MVTLPGFPTETSAPIELPDIGELLLYPAFQGIAADDYRKYATAFQKELLDAVPLRHDRKYVLVRSGVWLLRPGTRSHTNGEGAWHIDGVEDYDHIRPVERIHILSSACQALTEFNLHPLTIESPPGETREDLSTRIATDPDSFAICARAIEPGRIYTFQNHVHRAVDSRRIEFRFFLRVTEIDKPPYSSQPCTQLNLRSVGSAKWIPHITFEDHGVLIKYPAELEPGWRQPSEAGAADPAVRAQLPR